MIIGSPSFVLCVGRSATGSAATAFFSSIVNGISGLLCSRLASPAPVPPPAGAWSSCSLSTTPLAAWVSGAIGASAERRLKHAKNLSQQPGARSALCIDGETKAVISSKINSCFFISSGSFVKMGCCFSVYCAMLRLGSLVLAFFHGSGEIGPAIMMASRAAK